MGKSDEDALSVYREIIRADEPNATAIKILAKAYMDKERTDQEAMEDQYPGLSAFTTAMRDCCLRADSLIHSGWMRASAS